MTATPTTRPAIQRQVSLPISKAVEIAYKSIRLRLSRSLLVTSGIVLALAFLMSILAGEALIRGMRSWIDAAPQSETFRQVQSQRQSVEQAREPVEADILKRVRAAPAPGEGVAKFDPEETLGATLPQLQKDLGAALPVTGEELINALTTDASILEPLRRWIDQSRQIRDLREQANGPQQLASMMKQAGVPTTPQEIENNRIQTRWLIGLALLVAFVGILNAMLMSVTERFREIGTMKCLGALDGFIIKLFLIESLFQGIVGTIFGVIVGLLLSLVSGLTAYGGYALKNVPWGEIAAAVGLCLLIGVVLTVAGALYPAWQAARMQPVEAMRSDV